MEEEEKDDLIIDDLRASKQDAGPNLAGNVKQEFDLDKKFAKECGWIEFLSKECAYWISIFIKKRKIFILIRVDCFHLKEN